MLGVSVHRFMLLALPLALMFGLLANAVAVTIGSSYQDCNGHNGVTLT